MPMKQALILTDSVGAPRGSPVRTVYRDTWVAKVSAYLYSNNIEPFAFTDRGLNSTKFIQKIEQQFRLYEADIVILQVGVTDLNSRLLTESEKQFYNRLRRFSFLNNIINHHLERRSKYYRARNLMEIDFETAERNLARAKSLLGEPYIFIVPVVMAPKGIDIKLGGFHDRIKNYNRLLQKVFCEDKHIFIEEWQKTSSETIEEIYSKDHYHLTLEGHALLADVVMKSLQRHLKDN